MKLDGISWEYDMPLDSVTSLATTSHIDVWSDGLEPGLRTIENEPYSGTVALLIALLALLAMAMPQLKRIMSSLDSELLGVRRRANAFESHTASESRTLLLTVFTACVCEAILLGVATGGYNSISNPLLTGAFILLTTGYYLFQYTAYAVVGYTFTDKINASQWLKGFNLSQGLLGLTLILPAIAILYYHNATKFLLFTALLLYFMARIVYLCKGFRIFYTHFASLIYFILYLCTLEIIPVLTVVSIARQLDTVL